MEDSEGLTFHAALVELGVIHRLHVDRALSRSYFGHLKDVPLELVTAALSKLGDHAGEFFPKTEAIREMVDDIRVERAAIQLAEVPPPLQLVGDIDTSAPVTTRRHWFECNSCHDSGMRPVCPGGCADPELCQNQRIDFTCPLNDTAVERVLGPGMNGYRIPVKECECKPNNKTYRRTHPLIVGPGYSRKKRKKSYERNYVDGDS